MFFNARERKKSASHQRTRLDKEAAYHVDLFPKSKGFFLAYHPS